MYGDAHVLRRRTDQLREQAVDLRSMADRLVNQTESLGWRGRAATAMRERVTERAAHLREAATRHETAADSLERHGHERGRVVDAIADAERRARTTIDDARARVARAERASGDAADAGVRVEADPHDLDVARTTTPSPGHRDWLTFRLPDAPAS